MSNRRGLVTFWKNLAYIWSKRSSVKLIKYLTFDLDLTFQFWGAEIIVKVDNLDMIGNKFWTKYINFERHHFENRISTYQLNIFMILLGKSVIWRHKRRPCWHRSTTVDINVDMSIFREIKEIFPLDINCDDPAEVANLEVPVAKFYKDDFKLHRRGLSVHK